MAEQATFTSYLEALDEEEWNAAVSELQPAIHAVDRNATQIWFAFWPLKLTLGLQSAEEPLRVAKEWLLYGEYELHGAVDRSVSFLYGARWWSVVKNQILKHAEQSPFSQLRLSEHARILAEGASSQAREEVGVLLGISLVGLRAYRQIGHDRFQELADTESDFPFPAQSADQALKERLKKRKSGLMGWLRTVDQRYRVVWSENPRKQFEAIQGQDITMAAAADVENYSDTDPRRVEGPVPIQCRNGACGFCWVGVLHGKQNLSEITPFEKNRLATFGYAHLDDLNESHPLIRLACQARVYGDVRIVIPPWNGVLNGRR